MATIQTINATDQITTSRADINTNFANLNSDKIETSALDTDTALTANSDAKIPTQKAVKAYVDGVGVANASTTAAGKVEIATQTQVDAGTETGETGASLVVTPATLVGAQYSKVTFPGLTDTAISYNQSLTETDLFSTTITGGALGTNKIVRGIAYVTNYESNNAVVTLTLRLKYGSTTLNTVILDPNATFSGRRGYIEFLLMADGSVTAQSSMLKLNFLDFSLSPEAQAVVFQNLTYGTATENSATDLTFRLTGQWSSAAGSHNITTGIKYAEIIR